MMLQNDSLKFLVFAHHLSMLQACTEAVIENKVGFHLFIKHDLGCSFYILNINCSFYNWGGFFFLPSSDYGMYIYKLLLHILLQIIQMYIFLKLY